MNKVLISLYVPSIQEWYDVFLPDFVEVEKLIEMLRSSVEDLSNMFYKCSGEETLCLVDNKVRLLPSMTLSDYGVKNGAKLMLV